MNGLTAAAIRVNLKKRGQTRTWAQPWQTDAWDAFDSIPEVKFATYYIANLISRIRLISAVRTPTGEWEPAPNTLIEDALRRLEGYNGHAGMLFELTASLMVPGEAFLVGLADPTKQDDTPFTGQESDALELQITEVIDWTVRSVDELQGKGSGAYKLRDTADQEEREISDRDAFVLRIWQPHPRYSHLADSLLRGALSVCEEIQRIDRHLRAAGISRAAIGLLLLPDDLSFADDPTLEDGGAGDASTTAMQDPFMRALSAALETAIQDEGSARAVMRVLVRGPAESLNAIKTVDLGSSVEPKLSERGEALTRLAQGLNVPPEIITGKSSSNHWCVDTETEIYTRMGWKKYTDVLENDDALTLNHVTGLSEWQLIDSVNVFQVQDEPMQVVKHKFHSSMTTMNHRWPVLAPVTEPTPAGGARVIGYEREWRTTETLTHRDKIVTGALHAHVPTEAKYSDAFVELIGWFFTEGTCRYNNRRPREEQTPQIIIGQSHLANPDNVARIRHCLTSLFGPEHTGTVPRGAPPTWRAFVEERGMTLFSLNKAAAVLLLDVAPDRYVQRDFIEALTVTQLELFLVTAGRGDGATHDGLGSSVNQRDPQKLEAVELAAILVGRPVKTSTRLTGFFELKTQHFISMGTRSPMTTIKGVQVETYTGTVWCPTTKNRTWLARRDGQVFYTGNSAWNIDEQTFMAHAAPIVEMITAALTTGYIWPLLEASGMPPEEVRQLGIWYDPTPAITRPNHSQDADFGLNSIALSWASWRRTKGFDESDAPSEEEMQMRIAAQQPAAPGAPPGTAAGANSPPVATPLGAGGVVATPLLAAGDPADAETTTAMVALYVPDDVSLKLAVDGGLDPAELHVTLVFMGEMAGVDPEAVKTVLTSIAAEYEALSGVYKGGGVFPGAEDGADAVWVHPDVPHLSALREAIREGLVTAGVPVIDNHGFTPHTAVIYASPETTTDYLAQLPTEEIPVSFAQLVFMYGDERFEFPLRPSKKTVTAAAPATPRGKDLGKRLVELDQQMMSELVGLARAAVDRALEKAGAKVVSKLRKSDKKELIASVPVTEVCVLLGPDTITAAGIPIDDLLRNAFTKVGDRFRKLGKKTLRSTRRIIQDEADINGDLFEVDSAEDIAEDALLEAGALTLMEKLYLAATAFLYTPGEDPLDPESQGEATAEEAAIIGAVREAMHVAGGAEDMDYPTGTGLATGPASLGLVLGRTAEIELYDPAVHGDESRPARPGFAVPRWRWEYGDAERQAFPPHQDIDGIEFEGWQDDQLVNGEAWPYVTHFYPGDHAGCRCSAVPVIETLEGETDSEETTFVDINLTPSTPQEGEGMTAAAGTAVPSAGYTRLYRLFADMTPASHPAVFRDGFSFTLPAAVPAASSRAEALLSAESLIAAGSPTIVIPIISSNGPFTSTLVPPGTLTMTALPGQEWTLFHEHTH